MKLAFDTLLLSPQYRQVGIYQYAKNLFCEFRKIVASGSSSTVRYFLSPGYSESFLAPEPSPGFEPVPAAMLGSGLWRMGLVNFAAWRAGSDLVFSPAPKVVPIGIPTASTVHDIMPFKLPSEMLGGRSAYRLRAETWVAVKCSRHIFTDSEFSKRDIVNTFNVNPDKISVVYLGYDTTTFNSFPLDPVLQRSILAKFGISQRYIVHHGLVQLRKNLVRLVEAFHLVLERSRDADLQLVLAGGRGTGYNEIAQAANQLPPGRVVFTGPLPDEELAGLLKGAALAVVPSLYEGFGLPVVEAMACGTPTVASNSSCIPEISGGVLRYFDCLSIEDMAHVMMDVLNDDALQRELSQKGLQRAADFSWARCAHETFSALERLADAHPWTDKAGRSGNHPF